MLPVNSETIKLALLSYYRYKRQFICATEVHCGHCGELADVMVDTGTEIIEIEVKCSKSDLWNGEAKKSKHKWYKLTPNKGCNKFFICVPTELIPEAEKWAKEINDNYGIIEFCSNSLNGRQFRDFTCMHRIIKKAKNISLVYSTYLKEQIIRRACSEMINEKKNRILKSEKINASIINTKQIKPD